MSQTILIPVAYVNDGTIHQINIQPGFSAVSVRCVFGSATTTDTDTFTVDTDLTPGMLCVFSPSHNHWNDPVTLAVTSPFTDGTFNFSSKRSDGDDLLNDFSVTNLLLFFSSS